MVASVAISPLAPLHAGLDLIDQGGWVDRKRHIDLPNGIRLAYVEMGNPDGLPVILLHGYTDTSRVWTIVAPYLSGFRLIIPDQRGHGDSSKPEGCYAPAFFVHDLLLLMDELGLERAAIVGSSLGSMVAQMFAAEHPDRTMAIALAGSTALAPVERSDELSARLMDLDRPANADPAFLAEWSPSASPTPVGPEFVSYFDDEMTKVPAYVWRSVIRELCGFPVGRHAGDVSCPVLILSGGQDPLFGPEHHQSLVRSYPDAEATVFPHLGHNLVVERPTEVGPVLQGFLAQV